MNKDLIKKWDEHYCREEYAYGTEPNEYLKSQLKNIPTGTILFSAEGEGRNAVHAAAEGWKTAAFDISLEGQKKALQLADSKGVTIDYTIGNLPDLGYQPEQFDAIAIIYTHLPVEIRAEYMQLLNSYLRSGGYVIFEGFSKKHLEYNSKNPNVGGPRAIELLFSIEEIQKAFPDYEILELLETEIELREGTYHNGKGSVIRFLGRKK